MTVLLHNATVDPTSDAEQTGLIGQSSTSAAQIPWSGPDGLEPAGHPGDSPGEQPGPMVHTGAEPRMAAIAAIRVVMIAAAGLAALLDPTLIGAAQSRLGAVVAAWVLLFLVAESSRRLNVGVRVTTTVATLLDGVMITAVTIAAGGSASPLFFLAFIHVISVTLLASHIHGLRIAIWDSTLLLLAAAAQTSGAIPFLLAGDGAQAAAGVIRAAALLGVSGVTAGCSALNERELRRSRAGLQAMLATGQSLMATRTSEDAIQTALAALTGPLDCVAAACIVERRGGQPLLGRQLRGATSDPIVPDRQIRLPSLQGPMLRADPEDLGVPVLTEMLAGRANAVVVPMAGDQIRGVLAASVGGRPRRRGLPVRTLDLIESLSAQLGQTLERIELADAIAEAAASDGLTGVPNRRHFDERFEQMLDRAGATGQPLAVMAIDIDHFKAVNDNHGHQVGDEVLKVVAAALRESKRRDDVVARYGGEEFALLLPVTDLHGAIPLAERVRRAVAEADSPVPVTISVGVASTRESGMGSGPLFAAADQALYRAKADGRDCVRSATG